MGRGPPDDAGEFRQGPRQEVLEGLDMVRRHVLAADSMPATEGVEKATRPGPERLGQDGDDLGRSIRHGPPR